MVGYQLGADDSAYITRPWCADNRLGVKLYIFAVSKGSCR